MENQDLEKTSPVSTKRRRPWIKFALLGLLTLLLIGAISAFGGYQSGINIRKGAEATQVASVIHEQYALGELDLTNGQFDRARQRFEYVIRLDSNYPGAAEKLAEVLFRMNSTATATIGPTSTPAITPTPDTRNIDELFSQAQQYMMNKDWTNTIETLLKLRKADPGFHAVDIDGMLFLAYRNRGIEKITKAGLEEGLYDLTIAERFGPLDAEAQGFYAWTSLYITGASFWELNWERAVFYFQQVAAAYPSLMDGSRMTARERYRQALIGYADALSKEEKWCQAVQQYQLALDMGPDPKAEAAQAEAIKHCSGDTGKPQPPPSENPTPTQTVPPTEGVPTPTLEPTPTPTQEPTVVPTQASPTATSNP